MVVEEEERPLCRSCQFVLVEDQRAAVAAVVVQPETLVVLPWMLPTVQPSWHVDLLLPELALIVQSSVSWEATSPRYVLAASMNEQLQASACHCHRALWVSLRRRYELQASWCRRS